MTISFNNMTGLLKDTCKVLQAVTNGNNAAAFTAWLDHGHEVTVVMNRVLMNPGVPKGAQSSAYKTVKDMADVTIDPPNEELSATISKYFFSEKLPSLMGAPERLFFDEVVINKKLIIG
jgi:hypothetical protein